MSDIVEVALIAALPPTIAAIGAIFLGIINKGGIKQLHLTMNSRLDQLLAVTKSQAFADGIKSEQDRIK